MIPSRLIFVWIGEKLPLTTQAAIKSAYKNDKPNEIFLIHEGLDTSQPELKSLQNQYPLEVKKFNPQWFDSVPQKKKIQLIYSTLTQPVARSNIIRMIALWKWGGIYLDTDTITFKSLNPLRKQTSFCGEEPVLIPSEIKKRPINIAWIWISFLLIIRNMCAYFPQGYLVFKPLEKLCYHRVNNAIMGSIPKAPFLYQYFNQIAQIPKEQWKRRFYFGTYALQGLVKQKCNNLTVYPSHYFYPLGSEICNHWFRPNVLWKKILNKNCYVVHWYQSVETRYLKQSIDFKWLEKNSKTPFAQWLKPLFLNNQNDK